MITATIHIDLSTRIPGNKLASSYSNHFFIKFIMSKIQNVNRIRVFTPDLLVSKNLNGRYFW